MHVINARFDRMAHLSVSNLLGELGVYVLWDGRAKARPTYIGEGNILKRLVDHESRFDRPIDGYVAVLSNVATTWQRAKTAGTIVEAILLQVAKETDRRPSINVSSGQLRGLVSIFDRHGTIRINVTGMDPLRPPEDNPLIAGTKRIVLRELRDGSIELEHDWHLRRLGH